MIVRTDDIHYKTIANEIRRHVNEEHPLDYTPSAMATGVGRVYKSGMAIGKTEGYNSGFSVGREAGVQEGYENGNKDGYERGYAIGQEDGYNNGQTDGYNRGYAVGKEDGYADGRTAGYDAGMDEGYRVGLEVGHDNGVQDEQDRFWDAYQRNGTAGSYSYAFAGAGWTDETYNPKYPINAYNCNNLYINSNITDTKVPIDATAVNTNCQYMFGNTTTLHTVRKLIVNENTRNAYMFDGATALANITIEGTIGRTWNLQWCPLTKASVISIVNALSATATGYTVTFKKSAKEAAFTDDEWNALMATKPNWTFSLV